MSDAPAIDYFDDLPQPTEEQMAPTLERLTKLVAEARELEKEIGIDTVALAEKQGTLDKILQSFIPTIMEQLGLEEFKLTDGSKINVKPDIKCGITEERKPAAWEWLEATGNDGIIKTLVNASFGRGEIEQAKKAAEALHALGLQPTLDRSVHPSTLKSFVKEQLELGTNIPLETFGVYERKVAKITLPRSRK